MIFNKIIDGYSVKRLIIILAVFVYLDMLTTYIGFNMGMYEVNHLLRFILQYKPYLIFIYPLILLHLVFVFYLLFRKWEFEIKVGYILLTFNFAFAVITNILGMIL